MKEPAFRACARCKAPLTTDNSRFYKCRGSLLKNSYCKRCNTEVAREWRQSPAGRKRTRELRFRRRLREYGLTEQWYDEQFARQGGVCAICSKPATVRSTNASGRLHIDHCHKTNGVRGLLCGRCNTAIGLLGEDLGVAHRAHMYLRDWVCSLPVANNPYIQISA